MREWRKQALKYAKIMDFGGGDLSFFPPGSKVPLDYEGNTIACHCTHEAKCGIMGPLSGAFWCLDHCPIDKTLEKLGM